MKLLERMRGTDGIKIIVGSAFFWAWLDAMFMSMFFVRPGSRGLMAEAAVVAVFAVSAIGFSFALRAAAPFNKLLGERRFPLSAACLGTMGSLLFLLASVNLSWPSLLVGGACGGVFMAVFELAWGGAYCRDGARSAAPYVAGGFACAVVIDTPLLFMIPEAAAVFFALLPLATGLLYVSVAPNQRVYRQGLESPAFVQRGVRAHLKSHLGMSMTLLCAVMLVMVGFGYLQHLVSFSIVGGGSGYGIIIQVARGVVALLMFAIVVGSSQRVSTVYRVGLLAMIAGFMMMPFLFGTNLFWVSGAVIIGGYTAFDLLVWVAFSQIAHTQSRDPLKTIAVMRMLSVLCTVLGFAIGIALVGNEEPMSEFVSAETTVVGYLVVIATVLTLGSEDMWALSGRPAAFPEASAEDSFGQDERLGGWFDEIGLTAREREIGALLANGRTQPWIAVRLSISENTVGTHVRHIYQKAGVHGRQEFIDLAFPLSSNISPETRDPEDSLTEVG